MIILYNTLIYLFDGRIETLQHADKEEREICAD